MRIICAGRKHTFETKLDHRVSRDAFHIQTVALEKQIVRLRTVHRIDGARAASVVEVTPEQECQHRSPSHSHSTSRQRHSLRHIYELATVVAQAVVQIQRRLPPQALPILTLPLNRRLAHLPITAEPNPLALVAEGRVVVDIRRFVRLVAQHGVETGEHGVLVPIGVVARTARRRALDVERHAWVLGCR